MSKAESLLAGWFLLVLVIAVIGVVVVRGKR